MYHTFKRLATHSPVHPKQFPTTRPASDVGENIIELIVKHKDNLNRRHEHAEPGDLLFVVRWYNYGPGDDTREPMEHLPCSKVLSYFIRARIDIPSNMDDAMTG